MYVASEGGMIGGWGGIGEDEHSPTNLCFSQQA